MVYKKNKDSEVCVFNLKFKTSYKLLKAFREMHVDALVDFKKISHQRKLISKLKNEINDINSDLDFLKDEHQLNVFNTLTKKAVKIDWVKKR